MPSRGECKQPVNTARICLTQMPSPRHCLRWVLHFFSSPFNVFPCTFLLNYHPGILIRSASLPFPAAMTLLSICRVCILFFHLLFLCFSVCFLPPFLLILLPPTLLSSSRLSFSLLFFFAEQFFICLLPRLCFFIFFFSTVFFSHYLSCSFPPTYFVSFSHFLTTFYSFSYFLLSLIQPPSLKWVCLLFNACNFFTRLTLCWRSLQL